MNLIINYFDIVNPIKSKEIKLITSTFPAGENYLRIPEEDVELLKSISYSPVITNFISVTPLDAKANTIMDLLLLSNAVRELKVSINLLLNTYYLPYSRQDRACKEGESNSLKVFMDIVTDYYTLINTLDVHNPSVFYPVSWKLLLPDYKNDFISVRNSQKFEMPRENKENIIVVAVDFGAQSRCKNIISEFCLPEENLVIFNKVRDNGKITHTVVNGGEYLRDKENVFYIFDDICDGGGTFLSILERLNTFSPYSKKYLVVTHGIFSKGLEVLDGFDDVFVHNNPYNLAQRTK